MLTRRRLLFHAAAAALGGSGGPAHPKAAGAREPAVLRVGPTRRIRTPGEAARLAGDGDVVEVDAGDYVGDAAIWTQDTLAIRAADGPVRLVAGGRSAEGKAIWVLRGGRITVTGFAFTGARVPTGNGAGIRFESGALTLQDCRFLDNEMGLLSAGRPGMRLAIHRCEFGDAPRHDSGQLHHLLYVGAIDECEVTHSQFYNGWQGHLLKSRARVNRVLHSRFVDAPDGAASYELEFPEGGDILVEGNRIEQSAATRNPAMLSVGAEANGQQGSRLVLRDNHFVNHYAGSAEAPPRFVHVWRDRLNPLHVEASGNRFEGPGRTGLTP